MEGDHLETGERAELDGVANVELRSTKFAFVLGCLLIAVCVVMVPSASATWTCAQGATGCTVTTARTCATSGGASCNITVTSTHAHAVEALCMVATSATPTLSSTGDGGFTTATASHGTDATAGGAECAYNLNATGGATTIPCTLSASISAQCEFFEFTGTGSSFTFDTANTVDDSANCTSCAGVALTLTTANNYILVQVADAGGTASAVNQSYTGVFSGGDGFAFKINVSVAGTTPNWTQTSGHLAGGAIAIYEVTAAASSSAASKRVKLTRLGVR
jgi:hypothetical protein